MGRRKKGIAESRKGKRQAPKKPEKPEKPSEPEGAAEEHASSASESEAPPGRPAVKNIADREALRNVRVATEGLETAVKDLDDTIDDYIYQESLYDFSKTCIAATTRARGAAATTEATLKAEIEVLKARLLNTERLLNASDARADAAEAESALKDRMIEKLERQVEMATRLASLRKKNAEGTRSSGPVSS